MYERHLLSVLSEGEGLLHLAEKGTGTTTQYHTILGLDPQVFIFLMALLALILGVMITVCVIYRRHRTRQDYNEDPEQFPHLPKLSYKEEKNLDKLGL